MRAEYSATDSLFIVFAIILTLACYGENIANLSMMQMAMNLTTTLWPCLAVNRIVAWLLVLVFQRV